MFSMAEKRKIADAVEKAIMDLKHPEMPHKNPVFKLHIEGKESWSWADIEPNWIFDEGHRKPSVNLWNERRK